jgi:hypothetical protein
MQFETEAASLNTDTSLISPCSATDCLATSQHAIQVMKRMSAVVPIRFYILKETSIANELYRSMKETNTTFISAKETKKKILG